MALQVGQLFATLGLDSRNFDQGLTKAKGGLTGVAARLNDFTSKISGASIALKSLPFIGLVAGVSRFAQSIADNAEKLANLSATTGLTREQLQELRFVAEQGGFAFEGLTTASTMLQRKLMGVELDTGNATKVLKALGIEIHNSNGSLRSMGDLFPSVISKLQGMTNETQRNMYATQIFGRNLGDVAPLLALNAQQTEALKNQARALGIVIREDTLKEMDRLDAALDGFRATSESVWKGLQSLALPVLNELGADILEFAHDLGIATDAWHAYWAAATKSDVKSSNRVGVLNPLLSDVKAAKAAKAAWQKYLSEHPGQYSDAINAATLADYDRRIAAAQSIYDKASKKNWDIETPGPSLGGTSKGSRSSGTAEAKLNPVQEALKSMQVSLSTALAQESLLGDQFDLNAAKVGIYSSALQSLLDAGLKPADARVKSLANSLKILSEKTEDLKPDMPTAPGVEKRQKLFDIAIGTDYIKMLWEQIDAEKAKAKAEKEITAIEKERDEAIKRNADGTDLLSKATADLYAIQGKTSPQWEQMLTQLTRMAITVTNPLLKQGLLDMARLWGTVGRKAEEAAKKADGPWQSFLKDTKQNMEQLPRNLLDDMTSSLESFFMAAMQGKASFKDFANSILLDIERMVAKFAAMKVMQGLGGLFGGFLGDIGSVFGLAEGGYIRTPGPVIVGERGPELLNLPTGASVTPMDKAAGNISVQANFYGNISSEADVVRFGDALARQVQKRLALAR